MTYADLIGTLELPTPEQTWAFADHVADNHSWYKHLPLMLRTLLMARNDCARLRGE